MLENMGGTLEVMGKTLESGGKNKEKIWETMRGEQGPLSGAQGTVCVSSVVIVGLGPNAKQVKAS